MRPQPLQWWSERGDQNGDPHTEHLYNCQYTYHLDQNNGLHRLAVFHATLVVARIDVGIGATSAPGITCEVCVGSMLSTMVVGVQPTV